MWWSPRYARTLRDFVAPHFEATTTIKTRDSGELASWFSTGFPWSLVTPPYWTLVTRLGVIHWSLVTHSNI
jgi:hypothetical protein